MNVRGEPIAVGDVVRYLVGVLDAPEAAGEQQPNDNETDTGSGTAVHRVGVRIPRFQRSLTSAPSVGRDASSCRHGGSSHRVW